MHESSLIHFKNFADKYLPKEGRFKLADIGAMNVNGTYRDLCPSNCDYFGIDMAPGPNVDVVVSPDYDWRELSTGTFDVLICGQVLEHVEKPWRFVPECKRIVRPGGLLWFIAPNTWDYHAHPKDCWRIWPDGMAALFDESGLEVVQCFMAGCDTIGTARKPQ